MIQKIMVAVFFAVISVVSGSFAHAADVDVLTPYGVEMDNHVMCGSDIGLQFDAKPAVGKTVAATLVACLSKEELEQFLKEQNTTIQSPEEMVGMHFVKNEKPITMKLFNDVKNGREVFSRIMKD